MSLTSLRETPVDDLDVFSSLDLSFLKVSELMVLIWTVSSASSSSSLILSLVCLLLRGDTTVRPEAIVDSHDLLSQAKEEVLGLLDLLLEDEEEAAQPCTQECQSGIEIWIISLIFV